MRRPTVISRSALEVGKDQLPSSSDVKVMNAQYLQQRARLLVGLSEKTQREGGNGVMRPRAVEDGEEGLAVLQRDKS